MKAIKQSDVAANAVLAVFGSEEAIFVESNNSFKASTSGVYTPGQRLFVPAQCAFMYNWIIKGNKVPGLVVVGLLKSSPDAIGEEVIISVNALTAKGYGTVAEREQQCKSLGLDEKLYKAVETTVSRKGKIISAESPAYVASPDVKVYSIKVDPEKEDSKVILYTPSDQELVYQSSGWMLDLVFDPTTMSTDKCRFVRVENTDLLLLKNKKVHHWKYPEAGASWFSDETPASYLPHDPTRKDVVQEMQELLHAKQAKA
jgi:hypothetical protein